MEHQTYAQLQQRKQFLESIYQGVAHPIAVIDVLPSGEFRFAEMNSASERWMGKRLEEVKDKSPEQIFPVAEATAILAHYTQCVQGGIPIVYEAYCQTQDSWCLTTLTPLYDQESRIYRLISSSLDITERRHSELSLAQLFNQILISNLNQRTHDLQKTSKKLIEEINTCQYINIKLKESQQNLRQIAETLREVLFIRTVDQMLYVSPAYEKIWGYSCDSLYQQPDSWQDAIHPDDRDRVMAEWQTHRWEEPFESEYQIIQPNGEQCWIWARTLPILDDSGQVNRTVGIAEDITERKQTEAALCESEETFRQFAETIHDVFWMTNLEKTENIYISPVYEKIWGQSCTSWYTDSLSWLDTVHPDDRDYVRRAINKEVIGEFDEEYRIVRPDGEIRWIRDRAFPIYNEQGEMYRLAGIAQDITERKQTEAALQKSENRFRTSIDNILDCFNLYKSLRDDSGQILDFLIEYVNAASYRNHCLTQPLKIGQRLYPLLPHPYQTELFEAYCQVVETGKPFVKELLIYDDHSPPQKLRQAYDIRAVRFEDGLAVTWRDITKRKQSEAQIKASLIEKETLLKEIHHRVKNNLQIISSLLRLQARKLKAPEILELLQESQNRVQAMALIHEKLYQSDNLSKIDFGAYIKSLVDFLSRCYGSQQQGITFNLRIAPVSLSIDTAIPCGLIVNELVSNSLKYAFPDSRNGEICITLQPIKQTDEGEGEDQGDRKDQGNPLINATSVSLSSGHPEQLCLSISDNGIGFPEDLDFTETSSLGLQLVCRLIKQLNGEIKLDRNQGTLFMMTWGVL